MFGAIFTTFRATNSMLCATLSGKISSVGAPLSISGFFRATLVIPETLSAALLSALLSASLPNTMATILSSSIGAITVILGILGAVGAFLSVLVGAIGVSIGIIDVLVGAISVWSGAIGFLVGAMGVRNGSGNTGHHAVDIILRMLTGQVGPRGVQ